MQLGDATACFDNHEVIGKHMDDFGNTWRVGTGYVQRSFKESFNAHQHAVALALNDAGEACLLLFSDAAAERLMHNNLASDEFLQKMVKPLADKVDSLGSNDCLAEVHASDQQVMTAFEFLGQQQRQGVVAFADPGFASVASSDVQYAHPRSKVAPLLYNHQGFLELGNTVQGGGNVVTLATNGYVVASATKTHFATLLGPNNSTARYRVCSAEALQQQYPNAMGKIAALQQLNDQEIAARALPDSLYKQSDFEPAAYVACPK